MWVERKCVEMKLSMKLNSVISQIHLPPLHPFPLRSQFWFGCVAFLDQDDKFEGHMIMPRTHVKSVSHLEDPQNCTYLKHNPTPLETESAPLLCPTAIQHGQNSHCM